MAENSLGAIAIARLLRGEDESAITIAGLSDPWRGLATAVVAGAPGERARTNEKVLATLGKKGERMLQAIEAAGRDLDAPSRPEDPRRAGRQLGQSLPKNLAEAIERTAGECPDLEFRQEFFYALVRPGEKHRPLLERRKLDALAILADWLIAHGSFVRDEGDGAYFFWRDRRRLFPIRSDEFAVFIYELTAVNPASKNFAHLLDHCFAMAASAPRRPVVRVSAWDDEAQVLLVSRFDGVVYVLDGQSIREEGNGEASVIFDDGPTWVPYIPEFDGLEPLRWLTEELPNWDRDPALYALALLALLLITFLPELCPTRPLATLVGVKGSGKSALWRILLRLLFGPLAQVSGVPDRPDGFTAAAAAEHILVLDNLDDFTGWLRDKLARIASGADDIYRKLYSNNEVGWVRYRCWVWITARTPDTLKRDDLSDRLLLLPLARIDDAKRERETQLSATVAAMRGAFWGAVLTALNQLVASIRQGGLQAQPRLRLADWEVLGRAIARNEDREGLWDEVVDQILADQSSFLLEDDLVVEGLERWMTIEAHWGVERTARELQSELAGILFDDERPPKDWPRSSIGFGRRLASIRQDLTRQYDVYWGTGSEIKNHHRSVYRFWPKGKRPEQLGLL